MEEESTFERLVGDTVTKKFYIAQLFLFGSLIIMLGFGLWYTIDVCNNAQDLQTIYLKPYDRHAAFEAVGYRGARDNREFAYEHKFHHDVEYEIITIILYWLIMVVITLKFCINCVMYAKIKDFRGIEDIITKASENEVAGSFFDALASLSDITDAVHASSYRQSFLWFIVTYHVNMILFGGMYVAAGGYSAHDYYLTTFASALYVSIFLYGSRFALSMCVSSENRKKHCWVVPSLLCVGAVIVYVHYTIVFFHLVNNTDEVADQYMKVHYYKWCFGIFMAYWIATVLIKIVFGAVLMYKVYYADKDGDIDNGEEYGLIDGDITASLKMAFNKLQEWPAFVIINLQKVIDIATVVSFVGFLIVGQAFSAP